MFKKAFLIIMTSSAFAQDNLSIEIDISLQRLYLVDNSTIISSYPISSSKYGEGSKQNSFKTPLGSHMIKEMIGDQVPKNTIFISRINTQREAKIIHDQENSDNDYVTTRIMWLDGLEDGKNKGKGVDSYNRYIYIHGTHEEGLIGQKASHGCIRMFNSDVIELFSVVKKGTKVYIRA
jgi:lipoprotein-anchoring transpeptidase ErfK/SrfK